ncbi:MAG: 23S rRNA (guanosine(2251)-2'-O)-methyltransferase RlmB [Clostridia bacterium]|nr:23S rRNA (guanosine(2251)-2'-O)-methyltransferase RlmB [Clostridia bacterium]
MADRERFARKGKGESFKSAGNDGLKRKNREEGGFEEPSENVVAGRNAVSELLKSERTVDKLYIQKGEREGSLPLIVALATERRIPVVEVQKQKLDALAGAVRHQGVVALAAQKEYATLQDILDIAEQRGEPPFLVLCDGIDDPGNLGALIRCAEGAGAHGVVITKRRSVGLTAVVSKASAGALEHMAVAKVSNLSSAIDELKEAGLWIYGAEAGGKPCHKTDMKGPIAVVMGSEGQGISRLVADKCDFIVSIDMYGKVNSFNVSCAAAVILCEAVRQRHAEG